MGLLSVLAAGAAFVNVLTAPLGMSTEKEAPGHQSRRELMISTRLLAITVTSRGCLFISLAHAIDSNENKDESGWEN